MKHYQEITLIPDPVGMPIGHLWGRLFVLLHGALSRTDKDSKSVGVSFPNYEGLQLGAKVRVFASTEKDLQLLQLQHMFLRLSDYVHLSGIRQVPNIVEGHANFRRVQPKTCVVSIARRKAKRDGITFEEALGILGKPPKKPNLPSISMESQSSRQQYPLYVSRVLADKPVTGAYSTYGLSSTATVPLF